jgi:tetratricopeptide (TPR) repeat protein
MGFFRALLFLLFITPVFAESALDKKLSELKSTSDPAKIRVLERELGTLFEQTPSKTVSLLMQRTTLAMQKNEPDLAIHLLETVSEIAPTYAASYARRAIIKASQSREGEAISELEMALKYQPRDYRALAQLGFLFIKLEREKEALKAFDLALDLHPNFTRVKTTAEKLRLKLEGAKL